MQRRITASSIFALTVLALPLLAAASAAAAEEGASWSRRTRLIDVRHATSRDLSSELQTGLGRVELPSPVVVDGERWNALLVGPGWVRLADDATAGAVEHGGDLASPFRLSAPKLGPRIDVLSGPGVSAGKTPVLLLEDAEGVAVRWTGLELPSGETAVVEVILDRAGHVTMQYLHLPQTASHDIDSGYLWAGTSSSSAGTVAFGGAHGAALTPEPATAFTLLQPPPAGQPTLAAAGPPPAGCSVPAGSWCDVPQSDPDCLARAQSGAGGISACTDTVATEWSFDEQDFCQGCAYTFYVLVECGREMHLPLEDFEGGTVTVTNVITGQPLSLQCVNETARADAGEGAYPVFVTAECCASQPGEEQWWGPPFDEMDNNGPGSVTWGFPDCPLLSTYDVDSPADGVQCDELPCGGELSLISPGERQTMDCFIQDSAGLCGLYRVDFSSGGYVWQLFANCDGTDTPQFQIFHDCTEAWAAYDPLPELALEDLTTTGTCPGVNVEFDVLNLGCVEHPGDARVRLESDCTPPNSIDVVIPGPFPANSMRRVSVPFDLSWPCGPARITVTMDPDDEIMECAENPAAAACSAEVGLSSLGTFDCGCEATLQPDAGPDVTWCAGEMVTLDASASDVSPCGTPLYRWLNELGEEVSPASSDPVAFVDVDTCPMLLTLEVSCLGEPCTATDDVQVSCLAPLADAGPDVTACVGTDVRLDASGSVVPGCAQPTYRWLDADTLAVLQDWSDDPRLDLPAMTCADAGTYRVEVGCATGGSCFEQDEVELSCVQVIADVVPAQVPTCDGGGFVIGAADAGAITQGCSVVEYRWLDVMATPLTSWSTDVSYGGTLSGCPTSETFMLEARCADAGFESCSSTDSVVVSCTPPATPVPGSLDLCGEPRAALSCGVSEAGASYWWDLDSSFDADGDGETANDADLNGCDVTATFTTFGQWRVRSWAQGSTGCRSHADLTIDVAPDPTTPAPTVEPGCAGGPTTLSSGVGEAGVAYAWDLDVAFDADGNGVPDDDIDAVGLQVTAAFPAGDTQVRVQALGEDGCATSADVVVGVPEPPSAPSPVATSACAREDSTLRCGGSEPGVTYGWDLDPGLDTDANGVPDDDLDVIGCDVFVPFLPGNHELHAVAMDGMGAGAPARRASSSKHWSLRRSRRSVSRATMTST